MMKIKIVIERWAYGLKARSLCPSEPKRLNSGFALPPSSRKPCPLSLHTTFFTVYTRFSFYITEKKMLIFN
ncbi:MAG: hypothetical protein ACETWK_11390, partial [Candidatus Aminicenantaceae bacterium]